ncbi:hypothetical protein [Afipia broomeae]|uniref:IrrE N-terminal-like domain-containing protein n=1 Tax=Afipia broomeae ATCC 49717 TaxID=883078 RepID=K8PSL0_9BRAD|nr:hypothetical protein [Afipia broomeae]EKS41338.1 hypothetical protein HMPREF9695_00430 [Afipia broomeae ATCC 49717]
MFLTVGEMDKHVQLIADENQIVIHPTLKRLSRSYSVRVSEEIYIAPIKSVLSYAVALHELGHVLGPHQNSLRVLVRERAAWRWAKRNALVWSPRMQEHAETSIHWYEKNYRDIDKRQRSYLAIDDNSG